MIEVESLSPLMRIEPEAHQEHVENWALFKGFDRPSTETEAEDIARKLGLTNR
jgi:hypothetical protein